MSSADLKLVLALAALFAAFFVAPLCVLIAMSLSTDAEMHGFSVVTAETSERRASSRPEPEAGV